MILKTNFTITQRKTLGSRHVILNKLEGGERELIKVKDNIMKIPVA